MLRITDVRKSFGRVVAVDGLSLEVARGEVLGLLGPNGAGKTTTISMAVGLLRPDAGTVHFGDGHDQGPHGSPSDPRVRRRIGVAPQALAIYGELSGRENLDFFGTLYGLKGAAKRAAVDRVLELVGLTDRQHDLAEGYSGGMKRRLNLGAAMVHDPDLLIFDEPTAGVDPQSRHAIIEMVRLLKREGRTIVYSTHYMEEAERICDRVAIIDHGQLLALDSVRGLLSQYGGSSVVTLVRMNGDGVEHEERVETADPISVLSGALQHARVDQRPVHSARIDSPDLEMVFLKLTGRTLRD